MLLYYSCILTMTNIYRIWLGKEKMRKVKIESGTKKKTMYTNWC